MTTSRTLVRQTLEFDRPARVPRQAWVLPWAEARHPEWVARLQREYPDDLVTAPLISRTTLLDRVSRYEDGRHCGQQGREDRVGCVGRGDYRSLVDDRVTGI